MPGSPQASPSLRNATWALRTQFFVGGALFATLGVHIPSIKSHYGLGEQGLAIALLASGAGAVLALLQAGRVLARHAPRSVVPPMALVSVGAVGSLLVPSAYGWLLALMLAYGMAAALFDVAANDEASAIEREVRRPLMSGFHGMFSLGGMAGAATGSLLAAAGVSAGTHLVGASAALGVLALVGSRFMRLDDRQAGPSGPALSLPRGPLALLGLLAALGLVSEGALYDWSVLYLRQELGSSPVVASLAYASFSGAMATGRFGGDWVRARIGPVMLLRVSGALGAVGMALALAVPHPGVALAGFALVGLGFANIVPVLFSAAGRIPGVAAAHGIAAVSSMGYFGLMAGPPLVGFIAEARSLTAGLGIVIAFAALVAVCSRRALGGQGSLETTAGNGASGAGPAEAG